MFKKTIIVILMIMLTATISSAMDYKGKKVLFVDSYHTGYEWSDKILKGVRAVLEGSGVELRTAHMDTKRHTSEQFKKEAGLRVKTVIEKFKPDVVIASDDNAQKYLVVPYLKDTDLPVVFCGVNWDASMYGYPCKNITGMVEVDMIKELFQQLRHYSKGDRVGFLSADVATEHKLANFYSEHFFGGKMKTYFAKTFKDWKNEFLKAQKEVDMLCNHNNAGIKDWDPKEAEKFFIENTKIPTGSMVDWMARYNLIIAGRVPEEQGLWAAQSALKILDSTAPSDIPIVINKRAKLTINMKIGNALGIVFDTALLETADIIGVTTNHRK
jgi:ABC-type uncharacterized transport system substrate-binding protein